MVDPLPVPGPAVPSSPVRPTRRWWAVGAIVALMAATAVGGWWWTHRPPAPPSTDAAEEDLDALFAVANPGYLGPQACAECHANRLSEFSKTRHAAAFRTPQETTLPPGYTAEGAAYASYHPDLRFRMTREGTGCAQAVIRTSPVGERRRDFPVGAIYGAAGNADEIYFTWKGDALFELPMGWLHPVNAWAEQPYNPPEQDSLRTTTPRCVECHATWAEHIPGSENRYRRETMIRGVTCEKCHGPGQEHVAYHRAHPDEQASKAILHPGTLNRDRLMDVCGQCHSNVVRHRERPFSHRPGQPLDRAFQKLKAEGVENDHVADQVKYLRQSKCYQKTDTLTCITCHSPHRAEAAGDRACRKCHQPAECREQPKLPAAVRGECVACHMPRHNRGAVKFHRGDERYLFPVRPHLHRIAVYPEARDEVLLGYHRTQSDDASRTAAARLTKSLEDHWLAEADRLRAAHRLIPALGAAREALRLSPTPRVRTALQELITLQSSLDRGLREAQTAYTARQFPQAVEALERVLAVNPKHASAHGKLGTVLAILGQRDRATEHLQAVARCDPDDAYGDNMLGWLAYLDGDHASADEAFRRADERYPFTAEIQFRWGLALSGLGRWPDAEAKFRPGHPHRPRPSGRAAESQPGACGRGRRRKGSRSLAGRHGCASSRTPTSSPRSRRRTRTPASPPRRRKRPIGRWNGRKRTPNSWPASASA
ncbi:MAG: tetratricopeptide repeat protein [Gemmataceae bacterium]